MQQSGYKSPVWLRCLSCIWKASVSGAFYKCEAMLPLHLFILNGHAAVHRQGCRDGDNVNAAMPEVKVLAVNDLLIVTLTETEHFLKKVFHHW